MIWVLAFAALHMNIIFYEGSANGGLAHEKCVEARDILNATYGTDGVCYSIGITAAAWKDTPRITDGPKRPQGTSALAVLAGDGSGSRDAFE